MNNEQFRRLLLANAAKKDGTEKNGASSSSPSSSNAKGSSTPVALGSRARSSIPMTPRSVAGSRANAHLDFARQLAEKNQPGAENSQPQKKARTSAPKGSKLAQGYVDRAKTRQEQEEEDERAARLAALEESFKKEEIDQATYDRLRSEIAGGDLSSTHLVKGLDFKLLERVRKGEDVFNGESKTEKDEPEQAEEKQESELEEDADDILEKLESSEVKEKAKEKTQKKGQFAPTSLNPSQKRSRNQILAELKAAREAAKAKEESALGSKFKKIGAKKKQPGTRIERDSRGQEIMIIVDEDGNERRKVRKIDPKILEEQERERAALASGTVLGMEVPEFYKKQQAEREAEEEGKEISIFDDVGSDYDPLAGLEGSDDSSDEEDKKGAEGKEGDKEKPPGDMPPPPKPAAPGPKNWFKDSKTSLTSEQEYKSSGMDKAAFLAALEKAKAISAAEKSEEEKKAAEREERLKKKLLESSRDDQDLDFGFGSSRAEDEADLEEAKVKLSAWKEGGGDDDDDDDGHHGGGGKAARKRGSKKKKGDKNNFADVMRVIERNKSGG